MAASDLIRLARSPSAALTVGDLTGMGALATASAVAVVVTMASATMVDNTTAGTRFTAKPVFNAKHVAMRCLTPRS
jgi:hypothetical protein